MPVTSAIRRKIRAFLDPGDEIQYVFPADLRGSVTPSVLFVVTDRSITVLSTGLWSRRKPRSVLAVNPRNQRIGPVEVGSLTPWFEFNGMEYEVDDEYVAVVNAADADLRRRDAAPPDPLPDL
ncbi:hypothetical protein [Amycolatopsis suaedae]|uniref:Uncharacterized protein n=1 Tax=Amycolatopsis suaedae TaxID=2510978 RepID=A0A4Q7J0U8_9PSEU|nr:hypothetical protein [Amycolatopsis suaedae]RZQ60437.1 hypothetical protein EWH70_29520 [Amycolatopsis suaedae]